MAFGIDFTDCYVRKRDKDWWSVYSEGDEDWPAVYGVIVLGDFSERFLSPLSYWQQKNYRCQWRAGLARIISGEEHSCLVHRMYDLALTQAIMWWAMYRDKEEVRFQQHLFLLEWLKGPYDEMNPYDHVTAYGAVSENGDRISEWCVPLADVAAFYSTHATKW